MVFEISIELIEVKICIVIVICKQLKVFLLEKLKQVF